LKILANSLHAGIWSHSFPEELLLRSLSEEGHDVTAIRCDGRLEKKCVTMSGMGIKISDTARLVDSACQKCRQRRTLLEFRSPVRSLSLSECLLQTDIDSIDDSLRELTPYNWTEHEFLGHNVARAAAYEFVLEHKLNSQTIPDTLWTAFVGNVKSASIALCAAVRVMDSFHPDLVISYNALYSVNNVVNQEARRRGIKTWAIHSGLSHVNRYERLCVYDSTTIPGFSYSTTEWSHYLKAPLDPDDSAVATTHFMELLGGTSRFTYSKGVSKTSASDVRARLNIPPNRKILLATLTSGDEIFAAELAGLKPPTNEKSLFESSNAWLKWLIQEMPRFPNCHLILRVHPREMPNKRDSAVSQNSSILHQFFDSLPSTVSVNWPNDDLSLYEIAQITDVCVNFTSSAGIEMMMLGIPTVIPHNAFMAAYAPEISLRGRSRLELSAQISLALETGWSSDYTRLALKWWGFIFQRVGIDISDRLSYPSGGYTPTSASGAGRLLNKMLFQLAISGPPLVELKHLIRAGKLREIHKVIEAVEENQSHVIGFLGLPDNATSPKKMTDRDVVVITLQKILEELSLSWDPSSHVFQSISRFVCEN